MKSLIGRSSNMMKSGSLVALAAGCVGPAVAAEDTSSLRDSIIVIGSRPDDAPEKLDMTGPAFYAKWSGSTAADIFTKISTTMPQNKPGSLNPQEYVDIIAFMLMQSGYPTGSSELASNQGALAAIKIARPQ